MTLPFPEPGLRLIRQDDVDTFDRRMTGLREELNEAVWRLDEHYAQLKSAAPDRLGSLYNPADYPESLSGLFRVEWDFPNVDAASEDPSPRPSPRARGEGGMGRRSTRRSAAA